MPPLPIVPVSGLPRSGSTLLLQILAQNPAHHVTPTNDLVELVRLVRDRWMHCISFKAQGLDVVQPRIQSALCGLMTGYHGAELRQGKVVFDKSRGWPTMIEVVEAAFGAPCHMLITVRDVRAVLASFEKIHRRDTMTKHGPWAPTTEGRARGLLHEKSVVGASINAVRDALARGFRNRMVVVPYHELTNRPAETLARIHDRLGLAPFEYDFDHVEQITHEDDSVHGMRLHEIRQGAVQPAEAAPWQRFYSPQFSRELSLEYADITRLMVSDALPPPEPAPAPAPEPADESAPAAPME